MSSLLQDLRHAFRLLSGSPLFTAVATGSLALSIGANTAIYGVLDAVILRPLPVEGSQRLVSVFTGEIRGTPYGNSSYPDYLDYASGTDVLDGLAAYSGEVDFTLGGSSGPSERVEGELVTGNYFSLLRLKPEIGRLITPSDDVSGARVVVISYGLWKRRFGSSPEAVGATLRINAAPFIVIGVAPPRFRGLRLDAAPDLWVPMRSYGSVATGFMAELDVFEDRGVRWLNIVGRLSSDVDLERLRSALSLVAARLQEVYPDDYGDRTVSVQAATVGAALEDRGELIRFIGVLAVTVLLALFIACSNLATLLLGRGAVRRRELGVRRALGAGPGRLVRQLLTESTSLALLGGIGGLVVALGMLRLFRVFRLPGDVSLASLQLRLSPEVLVFGLGLSLLTGLIFGLLPALRAVNPDVVSALKGEPDWRSGPGSRLGGALVTAQVALCTILLVGAMLFARSLRSALQIDLGFETESTLAASIDLGAQGYQASAARDFYARLLQRVRSLPEIRNAALTMRAPVTPGGLRMTVSIDGYVPGAAEEMELNANVVGPEYFRTVGIPLLAGRYLEGRDSEGASGAVVVNRTMAERFWPGDDPLSGRISVTGEGGPWLDVVGVVADSKYRELGRETPPYIYFSLDQLFGLVGLRELDLVVRGSSDPTAVVPHLRAVVAELDGDVPLFNVRRLETQIAELLLPQRMGVALLGLLSGLSLILACMGIYGVVAYAVAMRSRDIAIRSALGARPRELLGLAMTDSMRPVAIGVALGLATALVVSDALDAFLFGVAPRDPLSLAGAGAILCLIGLLASWLPARRAAAIQPMEVLRRE